jgi:hypothetical protein
MDALQIFPALLALMIATLAALGYALHRLDEVPNRFAVPLTSAGQCPHCGQNLAVGWRHCPACGMLVQSIGPLSGMAQQAAEGAGPHGLANRQ